MEVDTAVAAFLPTFPGLERYLEVDMKPVATEGSLACFPGSKKLPIELMVLPCIAGASVEYTTAPVAYAHASNRPLHAVATN